MAVIGLGTDIVEIARIETQLARSDRLARWVLTDFEFSLFQAHKFPARYLAKRFAAKEAAVKALGTGFAEGIGVRQVEVRSRENQQPYLCFYGEMQTRCEAAGVVNSFVSISDEKHYAMATVILEAN